MSTIGRSRANSGGGGGGGGGSSTAGVVAYSITGQNATLWARATEAERRAVIEAFGSNEVTTVAMVNAHINDAVGQLWGEVLQRNRSIVSLNLESNSISSDGMCALAAGLRVNSTLLELKLANQHVAASGAAEMEVS